MNVNQDIGKSRWWILNKLKRESVLYGTKSFTFDTQEKGDKYTRKQQQKLLDKLSKEGAIECSAIHTNLDDYAVTSGQQDHWNTRNYEISLIQPAFSNLYQSYEKSHAYTSLEHVDKTVKYKSGTIEQGNAHHTFKQAPELAAILSVLWQRRRIVSGSVLKEVGIPCSMNGLNNSLLDSAPNLTDKRIISLCNGFNKTMQRKNIDAKITRRSGFLLTVDETVER